MFKTTNGSIRKGIKQNAYIENVNIKKGINGIITLDIKERKPEYIISYNDQYVYINNQGYILEISKEKLDVPIIIGFVTNFAEIEIGNRLDLDDLNKLDTIIKIMDSTKNNLTNNQITKIDVSSVNEYRLTIKGQKKTIIIDDISNLNIKLQMAEQVMNYEKGKSGEIYFQENGKKAIFKEEVSR